MHADFSRQIAADHIKMLTDEAHVSRHVRRSRRLLRNPVRRAH